MRAVKHTLISDFTLNVMSMREPFLTYSDFVMMIESFDNYWLVRFGLFLLFDVNDVRAATHLSFDGTILDDDWFLCSYGTQHQRSKV